MVIKDVPSRYQSRVDSTKDWLGEGEVVKLGSGGQAQVVQESVVSWQQRFGQLGRVELFLLLG